MVILASFYQSVRKLFCFCLIRSRLFSAGKAAPYVTLHLYRLADLQEAYCLPQHFPICTAAKPGSKMEAVPYRIYLTMESLQPM